MQTDNTIATSAPRSGNRTSRHSRSSRSSYRYEARIRRYKFLLAGILMLFVLTQTFTWFYIAGKSAESEQALLASRVHEQSLNRLNSELETVKKERDALVQNRIPGLLPLTYDETITTDKEAVRNIIFTQVKNHKTKTYEYRLVMNNNTLSPIRPTVDIMLFNEVGIQVGSAHVETANASTGAASPMLEPGEVRSYTATIDLLRNEVPRYFLLSVSNMNEASANKPRKHGD